MADRMAGGSICKAKGRRIRANTLRRTSFEQRYRMTHREWYLFKKECRKNKEGYKIDEMMRRAYKLAFNK